MRFQCPFCRGIVAVDNSDLGIECQCGHCSEVVTAPCSRVATGAVIADFIILEELGRGGMGIVYLAHQISLDRPAAVKILSDTYANNAEFVVGFIKEARAAAKLNHPHIVQAYAVGEDDGVFFFAMEHVDGETMKDVLKREHVISIDHAVTIIQQIAEALDYAWKEQRLVHRDIKPDNIMITKNGRAKLADLGLARVAGDLDDSESDEVMGTPQYISPEHLTGAPMDVRSDLYSLGATFYHFITGRFPFEGKSATEIARKHLEERLTPPEKVNLAVPESVSLIIQKMMAKNIKARYQDAEELVEDLRSFRRGKAPTASGGLRPPSGPIGKKQLKVNTKTGSYMAADPGVVTATGPLHIQTTTGTLHGSGSYSHTATSTHGMKKLQAEQRAKKQLLLMVGGCILLILLCIIIVVIVQGRKSKPAIPPTVQQPDNQQPQVVQPTVTKYTKFIDEILAYAQKNPNDEAKILEYCEGFLAKNPEPQSDLEKQKLAALMTLYVPIDESVNILPSRKEAREKYNKIIAARREKLSDELKRKQQAELQEKQKQADKLRKEQEEKARKDAELKRQKDYIAGLDEERNKQRSLFIDHVARKDFKAAKEQFSESVKEPEKVVGRSKEEIEAAEAQKKWGLKMQDCIEQTEKLHNAVFNSGTILAGLQIEARAGILGKISEIKGANISLALSGGGSLSVPLDQIPAKQQIRIFKKAAENIKDDNATFYYMLSNGDFLTAAELSPSDDWKNEASKIALEYFKYKLKSGSDADKAELLKKFKGMQELKDAQGATN